MPVEFRQPDPFAPQISQAYGAAAQGQQDLPSIAAAYNARAGTTVQAAHLAAQRNQAAADNATRAQVANYANLQNAFDQQAQYDTREQDRELARQHLESQVAVNAPQVFAAQAEQARQAQAAQLRAWVDQQDLSYKEQLHLNQLKGLVPEVMNDPEISDGERQSQLAQLASGIDPYERRLKRSQARMMDERAEQIKAQARMHADAEAMNAEAMANLTRQGKNAVMIADEHGRKHLMVVDKDGNLSNPLLDRQEHEQKAREAAANLEVKHIENYQRMKAEAVKEGMAEAARQTKNIQDKGGSVSDTIQEDWINTMMRRHDIPASYEDYRRRYGIGGGGQRQPGGGDAGGGTWEDKAPAPPPAEAKPFRADDPSTMDATQSSLVRRGNADLQAIQARPDLPDGQKQFAELAMRDAISLLAKYGSVERMRKESPDAYWLWEQHKAELAKLTPPVPPPTPPPAAAAPAPEPRRYVYPLSR